ncbi:MAG: DMT family transporter [Clostridia bacterium]
MMSSKHGKSIFYAILAAALYAISSPISKLLLNDIAPVMLASYLYLGAGTGMLILGLLTKNTAKEKSEKHLTRKELPFTVGMIALDIAAPIFLMLGLTKTTAANASLLNNFEIVATSLIALFIFSEKISKRLWIAISLVTVSSIVLSMNDTGAFSFSIGSLFILMACICWGFENNCTRMMSSKNPVDIVIIKGFGSGIGSLAVAFVIGETMASFGYIMLAMLLGFTAYGLSIFFYIYAQRELGAAKTSTYYAIAPFIGVAFSLVIFLEVPSLSFILALVIMIIGTYFAVTDVQSHK